MAAVAILGLGTAGVANAAAELSLLSGFFQDQNNKVNDNDAGSKSTISLGARLSMPIEGHLFWFGEAALAMKSYSKSSAASKGPSDTTGLSLGGGVRYFFNKFSESFFPFGEVAAHYRDDKDASFNQPFDGSFTETENSGLYYDAAVGIRMSLDKTYFVDLSTQLFESALFATEDSNITQANGTQTKNQTKRTELFAATTGNLSTTTVAFGMRF